MCMRVTTLTRVMQADMWRAHVVVWRQWAVLAPRRHASFYDDRILDYVSMTPKRVAFQDMMVRRHVC